MKSIIIGGGPSGVMAAITLAKNGEEVTLLEANDKICKKLYITGKGRCNITNATDVEGVLSNTVTNHKFLFSALNGFKPKDTMSLLDDMGVPYKIERGNRVFPESDKSSDIIAGFKQLLSQFGVKVILNAKVNYVKQVESGYFEVSTKEEKYLCEKVVVATGGKSYPATGSTGDGYKFAKMFGHKIVDPKPALVPIVLKDYDGSLSGLSLKNVDCKIKVGNKSFNLFGEMLFTHEGVSGPIILSLSSLINKYDVADAKMYIDFKPALTNDQLEARIIRDLPEYNNKDLKNYLFELLPKSFIPYFMKNLSYENKKVNEITKANRQEIVSKLKAFPFTIKKLGDIKEGIVTSGGVATNQLNSKNMESKLVKNLFFVGEVVDVDALTGGFNIQIALSTGYAVDNKIDEEN